MDANDARPALDGVRLLLAEDDPLILMDLEQLLLEAGAEIVGSCQSVQAALDCSASMDFSAAILDIRLGADNIAPVARRLQSRGIPFVFYSGQTSADLVDTDLPKSRIVPKPSSPQTILDAVVRLMTD